VTFYLLCTTAKNCLFLTLIELYDGLTSSSAWHETIDHERASMYDRPSLSIFAVIASLRRNYAEALSRNDVKAIVLTGIFWVKRNYSRASHAGAMFQVFHMSCRCQGEVLRRI
jgi:hypothetical protein